MKSCLAEQSLRSIPTQPIHVFSTFRPVDIYETICKSSFTCSFAAIQLPPALTLAGYDDDLVARLGLPSSCITSRAPLALNALVAQWHAGTQQRFFRKTPGFPFWCQPFFSQSACSTTNRIDYSYIWLNLISQHTRVLT